MEMEVAVFVFSFYTAAAGRTSILTKTKDTMETNKTEHPTWERI